MFIRRERLEGLRDKKNNDTHAKISKLLNKFGISGDISNVNWDHAPPYQNEFTFPASSIYNYLLKHDSNNKNIAMVLLDEGVYMLGPSDMLLHEYEEMDKSQRRSLYDSIDEIVTFAIEKANGAFPFSKHHTYASIVHMTGFYLEFKLYDNEVYKNFF